MPVTITEPPSDVLAEWNVAVPMRDGVLLRVNVFRPDDDVEHPVLVCAHPYGKDNLPRRRRFRAGYRTPLQYRMLQTGPVTHSAWTGWEAPDPAYWVQRGYVVVNADLRGWGTSDGVGELFSAQEGLDCHDLIEWAGVQSWSNGRVGMSGVSYLAISQWAAAATRPPHLAAICPWEGFTDFYRDFARPGGIRENGFLDRVDRPGCASVSTIQWMSPRNHAGDPSIDEWWAARNRAIEDIVVPALICGSYSDHNLHSRGSFEGFRRIGSEQKWLYTHRGQKWSTYYSAAGLQVQAQFFDHFLRGDGHRHPADPARPDRGQGGRQHRHGRPVHHQLAATRHRLAHSCISAATTPCWTLRHPPAVEHSFDIRRGRLSFTHRFAQDTEIVGPMLLTVPISVTGTDDVALFAGVRKFRHGREIGFHGSYGFPAGPGDPRDAARLAPAHRSGPLNAPSPLPPAHRPRAAGPGSAGRAADRTPAVGDPVPGR